MILLVLLLLGPYLQNLPVACLSSIIVVNIRTLFLQFTKLPCLWRLCKYDFVSLLIMMLFSRLKALNKLDTESSVFFLLIR